MNSIFNKYYREYDKWYDENKYAYLSELEAIRRVLPKRGKGLEIGVGTARFSAPLGIKYGIDPSENMIKIARAKGINAKLGVGEKLPFKNATFDYVAIIITLCFVEDPTRVLEETKRVLKENGKVIIGIIDKDSFLGKFYQRKESMFYKQASFFSVLDLITLLTTIGFKKISCVQTLFKLPNKINSIEKSQRGYGKGGFIVISAEK